MIGDLKTATTKTRLLKAAAGIKTPGVVRKPQGGPCSAKEGQSDGASILVHLVLPVPPTTNHLFATTRDGHRIKSKEAGQYADDVRMLAAAAKVRPFAGPVQVWLHWFRSERRGDLANREKCLVDALSGCLWEDDSQIDGIVMSRHEDPINPRLELIAIGRRSA